MATFSHDKTSSDVSVSLLLDEALCHNEYPNPHNVDLIGLKEYDRSSRQVFLWVTNLFTEEEWKFIENFMIDKLHHRTRVSICRSNYHFGIKNE